MELYYNNKFNEISCKKIHGNKGICICKKVGKKTAAVFSYATVYREEIYIEIGNISFKLFFIKIYI